MIKVNKKGSVKRLRCLFLVVCMLSIVSACVSPADKSVSSNTPSQTIKAKAADKQLIRRVTVVTTGKAKLNPAKPSAIRWNGEVQVLGTHGNFSSAELVGLIKQQVLNRVSLKGYSIVPEQGDIQLAVLLLESGTLVLGLKQGRLLRWRGTAQLYWGDDLGFQSIEWQVDSALQQLLKTWP